MALSATQTIGSTSRVRRNLRRFFIGGNLPVFIAAILLVAYGLVVVYSASLSISEASLSRQALGTLIGAVLAVLVWQFDYRKLEGAAIPLLVFDCILMVLPLIPFLGYNANGLTGWIRIPGIGLTFQTSELAKPVTIVMMAALASRFAGHITTLRDYVMLCLILCIPFILIMLQPDLGTGLILLISGAAVIIVAGPRKSWVFVTIGIVIGIVVLLIVTDSIIDAAVGDDNSLIKDYQMNRLLVFLNPDLDSSGSGYNLQQSLIAVGSGGLFGKGIGNATQAGSGFLPEAHTDFVFALLAEEFGFVGAVALLILFTLLILFSLRVAIHCESVFGKLIVIGISAMWAFQIFENIGMCLSLMPITGIPLPFISYGSSSMIAQLLAVGLVQSVSAHKADIAP